MIEEIVTCVDEKGRDSIVFSQLKYLRLSRLPRLATFCSMDCNFVFPSLEDIIVMGCINMQHFSKGAVSSPKLQKVKFIEENDEGRWEGNLNTTMQHLFMEKVGYYALENLKISNSELLDEAIIEIWNRNPREILPFTKLKSLEVSNYTNRRYLLTPSMALGLINLQDLKVSNCATMEHVIMGDRAEGVFPKLNSINLESCSNLACFYEGTSMLKLPSLKEITVAHCAAMVTFAYGSSREQDNVSTADGAGSEERHDILIQPFFSNKIEVLNLEILKLLGNINIQQIWHKRVPEMTSFVRNLIEVKSCNNLKYLLTSSMVKSLEHLKCLIVSNCKMMEGVIVPEEGLAEEETMQKIFFPNLQALVLDDLPKLKRFCFGNYIQFPCLTGIMINKCPLLKTFTSSPVIGDIAVSIEKAENTSTLPLFDAKVAIPVLEKLAIHHMRRLHKIWHNQLDAESFCKLKHVCVVGCKILESIFPFSMLERLQRLEELLIMECDSLEEIFEPQGPIASYSQALVLPTSIETETQLVLPKLTVLVLQSLPKLKGFCHPKHITKCPSLKKLVVVGFQQLEIFALEFPSFQSTTSDEQLETRVQRPLFWINKATFPNLEELVLGMIGSQIWHENYAGDFFPKLKNLQLINFDDEQSFVPPFFFQSLSSIENLVVSYASLDEIFQCEGSGGKARTASTLTQLREFLLPSIISLRNLQALEVSRCCRLLSLVRYSTAKSLVQLTRMSISECDMIEEIVACVDDEVKEGIVFSQLKYLQLSCLPRLVSFCSVECNFEFPSLEEIIVMGCPNMQLFSKGELSTPKLLKVKLTEEDDEGRWEGNLNTSLQRLFMEKLGYYGLKNLKISESESFNQEIIEIWNRNPGEILPFRELETLEVSNYNGWRYLLTPSMALGLMCLQDLKVSNCAIMEHVITGDGAEDVFPRLNSINLESCSNLTCFYEGTSMLKLPTLEQITVANCPAMVKFASRSSKEQDNISTSDGRGSEERHDIHFQPFFSNKAEVLNLKILKLSGNINIQQLWHNRIPEMSSLVRNLIKCTVEGCDRLKYLLTSSMVNSLENLRCLLVRNCKMMEGVIVTEGFAEEERMQKIFFPNLQVLLLEDLPKLIRFCSGNCIEFPCLNGIVINHCPLLEVFTSSLVIGDITISKQKAENASTPSLFDSKVAIPVLEMLAIHHMESLHKIWHNQLDAESFCKLKVLSIIHCDTLESIFPFSMLERLQRLENLFICKCDSLEEIFEPQGQMASCSQALVASQPTLVETETKLVLPNLEKLCLESLPKLKGFYHPIDIIKCPSLKTLDVVGFQQLEIFALELPSFQRTTSDDQLETRVKHPLFWINKATFSNLEELKLEKIGSLKEIWRGQCAGDYFPKLKRLKLIHLPEQSVVPPFFLQSFPSLEKLVVSDASLDEIFQCEGSGCEGRPAGALTQLSELRLSNLNELMHLWKVKPNLEPIVYNLRALEVLECSKLMNLVPSIISLRKLQTLEVSGCHGLRSLMRYSTAKSLEQLTRMSISGCDMIGEIVACPDDEVKDGIVFSKLKYLRLKGLPKLATFCSMECNFEFPSLEDLIVMDCPDMQFFSKGELNTPKLQKVKLIEEDDGGCTPARPFLEGVIVLEESRY